MTPTEINIAIAEHLGWKFIHEDCEEALKLARHPCHWLVGVSPINQETDGWEIRKPFWLIPDYYNDLNAMHEAESYMIEDTQLDDTPFEFIYRAILGWPTDDLCWHATAPQRAYAFLRTIGKWKDCR